MIATPNAYRELVRSRVLGALAMANSAENVSHNVLKGRIREILISELFRPLLPADISVLSGQLIECATGQLSPQQDVILCDSSLLPPIAFDPSAAIVPVESVLYTIEVKSNLSKRELIKSHRSAAVVGSFNLLQSFEMRDGAERPVQWQAKPVQVLFSLKGMGRSKNAVLDCYRRVCGAESSALKAICVAGTAYWYEDNGRWVCVEPRDAGDEILTFLSGVLNTYKQVREKRGYYRLGQYLTPPSRPLKRLCSRFM